MKKLLNLVMALLVIVSFSINCSQARERSCGPISDSKSCGGACPANQGCVNIKAGENGFECGCVENPRLCGSLSPTADDRGIPGNVICSAQACTNTRPLPGTDTNEHQTCRFNPFSSECGCLWISDVEALE